MKYKLSERILKNKNIKKIIPVISFEDPQFILLSEFIMADGMLLMEQIFEDMNVLDHGDRQVIKTSGNRCGLEMRKDEIIIYDLFEDISPSDALPRVKINPSELKNFLLMWKEVRLQYL